MYADRLQEDGCGVSQHDSSKGYLLGKLVTKISDVIRDYLIAAKHNVRLTNIEIVFVQERNREKK